jgi:hypothetical protein
MIPWDSSLKTVDSFSGITPADPTSDEARQIDRRSDLGTILTVANRWEGGEFLEEMEIGSEAQ